MLLSGAGESSRNRSRSWTGSTTLPGGRMYVHVGSIWRKDITSHEREDGGVHCTYRLFGCCCSPLWAVCCRFSKTTYCNTVAAIISYQRAQAINPSIVLFTICKLWEKKRYDSLCFFENKIKNIIVCTKKCNLIFFFYLWSKTKYKASKNRKMLEINI